MDKITPVKAEIVQFQVRYYRYHSPTTDDFDTLEEALSFSLYLHDYGEGYVTGIWEGDHELMDHDAWFKKVLACEEGYCRD